MTRPFAYSVIVSALIVLANWWLSLNLSDWSISFGGENQRAIWATLTTGFIALLQFPALIASKWTADTFNLSSVGWAAVTSTVSILIYSPLVYVCSKRRMNSSRDRHV